MLRRLTFQNFKSWPKADIKFGRITGLFGTNSSGKTSLIQFLLLLKQTKDATDRGISLDLNGPYVSLGAYRDLIHKRIPDLHLSWVLELETPKDLALVDPSGKRTSTIARSRNIEIQCDVRPWDQGAVSTRLVYRLGEMSFSLTPKGASDRDFDLFAEGGDFRFVRTQGRPWQLPGPVKSYAFPDQASGSLQS
jgi:hypothetical protein